MSELPARKRPLRAVRRLDHEAVDVRLDATLLDYGRVSREAGLTSEEAVARLRGLLDTGEAEPARAFPFPRVSARTIALGVGAAALAVLLWVVGGALSAAPEGPAGPVALAESPAAGVGGFAEIFVATFLGQAGEGTEAVLEPFLAEPVELLGLAPGRLYVQNVATLEFEPTSTGWSVVVAAQVLRRIEGGYGDTALQFYRVEVIGDERLHSPVVPTQIAGP